MTTLRHQIGQMLIMGFSGPTIDAHSPVAEWLSSDGLGGVILFDYDLINQRPGKNIIDHDQIKQLTHQIKEYGQQSGLLPFIAIDYEGGTVDRLSRIDGCFKTKKACELALLDDEALRIEVEKMASLLQKLGFNLNFAPVVDLNLNEEQGIIGKLGRSFSANPNRVAHIANIFVDVFAKQGLSCCFKHFPGHGSAIGDTHQGFVDVTDSFQSRELEPYSLLMDTCKWPTLIMTAHVINRHLDSSGLPATLSSPILTGLLRQELGFKGLIVSDDLQMQAISNHYSLQDTLKLTINAGADMLIFANQLGTIGATELIDKIEGMVHAELIPIQRIEQAYQRILMFKQRQWEEIP